MRAGFDRPRYNKKLLTILSRHRIIAVAYEVIGMQKSVYKAFPLRWFPNVNELILIC